MQWWALPRQTSSGSLYAKPFWTPSPASTPAPPPPQAPGAAQRAQHASGRQTWLTGGSKKKRRLPSNCLWLQQQLSNPELQGLPGELQHALTAVSLNAFYSSLAWHLSQVTSTHVQPEPPTKSDLGHHGGGHFWVCSQLQAACWRKHLQQQALHQQASPSQHLYTGTPRQEQSLLAPPGVCIPATPLRPPWQPPSRRPPITSLGPGQLPSWPLSCPPPAEGLHRAGCLFPRCALMSYAVTDAVLKHAFYTSIIVKILHTCQQKLSVCGASLLSSDRLVLSITLVTVEVQTLNVRQKDIIPDLILHAVTILRCALSHMQPQPQGSGAI